MTRWAAVAAVVGGLVLLLTGCGSEEPSSVAPDPAYETVTSEPSTDAAVGDVTTAPSSVSSLPDPCALVSKQEAEKIAGTALGEAVASEASCTYTGPPSGPLGQFEVYVGPGAKKFLDIDVSIGHEFTDLTGVGEEAVIEDGAVFFRVGQTWVALKVTRLDELSAYRADLVARAKIVARRL